jgi:hypothetical protein
MVPAGKLEIGRVSTGAPFCGRDHWQTPRGIEEIISPVIK